MASRPALQNKTNNVQLNTTLASYFTQPKRSQDEATLERITKRPRLSKVEQDEDDTDSDATDIEDQVCESKPVVLQQTSMFTMIRNMHRQPPNAFFRQPILPTRLILQSFVSSNKADTYKCDSTRSDFHLTTPYACTYSHSAKRGDKPLLAVATEEGAVQILDTSKRREWDYEPQRKILQPHANGIFDVKWHHSDDLIATASGDQTVSVTSVSQNACIANLRGHSLTVKCVNWDPKHSDLLCSGGRDGNILVWDLRVGESHRKGGEEQVMSPVIVIPRAHDDISSKPGPKSKKFVRSVTSITYLSGKPFSIVSSGSFDGILREWDTRLPTRKTKSPRKQVRPVLTSPLDPTTLSEDSRRARGITDVTLGSGPTQGLLFALGYDSQIRTYHAGTLDPLHHSNFSDPNLKSNSFYVKSSLSPCGRWLATGCSSDGKAFLFDVSNASKRIEINGMGAGLELKGHVGEVGAIDWASNTLATSADDGTVRVWRPDVEVYRKCVRDPEEGKWDWRWANGS